MIHEKGTTVIQQQTAALLKTQQQASTGRRVLTPADDPIASARALELGQSRAVNQQFAFNIGYADDNLKLFENKLAGVADVLQYTRERAVQAGNGTLTRVDLGYIAADLKSQFGALLGIANSQDGQGDYIFAGYKANTKPFSGSPGSVRYEGDQGGRTIQVSASRFMPISLPGSDVFDKTRPLDSKLVQTFGAATNEGQAAMTGTLASGFPAAEAELDLLGRRLQVQVNVSDDDPPLRSYDVYEYVPGVPDRITVATGLADLASLADRGSPHYRGVELTPAADHENGDRFEIFVGSTGVFANLAMFIDAMERPGYSAMTGAVAFALDGVDAGLENVLRIRAQVGSQMVETGQLRTVGDDLDLQYAQAISRLEDVDYAEVISRLTLQQTYLQAAQLSFMRVSNLSLFNYLN
jgi:flagellar hook-associated protein 3 FlgL